MRIRSIIPQSRKHVHIYDEDWEFLAAVYNSENGSSIRGPKQFRIQHHLDGLHTVEVTPQLGQQSIGVETVGPVVACLEP